MLRHPTWLLLPTAVVILAFLLTSPSPLARSLPSLTTKLKTYSSSYYSSLSKPTLTHTSPKMPKAPVYFFSHGGVSFTPPQLPKAVV